MFKGWIWRSGPSPWEVWTCKGQVEVSISNGSGIRDPQFGIVTNWTRENWPKARSNRVNAEACASQSMHFCSCCWSQTHQWIRNPRPQSQTLSKSVFLIPLTEYYIYPNWLSHLHTTPRDRPAQPRLRARPPLLSGPVRPFRPGPDRAAGGNASDGKALIEGIGTPDSKSVFLM